MSKRRQGLSKRIPVLIMVMLLGCMTPLTAWAGAKTKAEVMEGATLTLDGALIKLNDPIQSLDNRLFLPVAQVSKLLDATVKWDAGAEEVIIETSSGDRITLRDGVPTVYFNEQRYRMDVAPYFNEGRLYAPLRTLAELLQASAQWNAADNQVELKTLKVRSVSAQIYSQEAKSYTDKEIELLEKITQVEAGYESYEGQLAVANVILNRVSDSRFPGSIRDVIYSGKQFPPAHNGLLDKSKPNNSVKRAVRDALDGKNNVKDAIYFYNPKYSKGGFWASLEVIETIGVHRFAK